jgi:hypothetical protein
MKTLVAPVYLQLTKDINIFKKDIIATNGAEETKAATS